MPLDTLPLSTRSETLSHQWMPLDTPPLSTCSATSGCPSTLLPQHPLRDADHLSTCSAMLSHQWMPLDTPPLSTCAVAHITYRPSGLYTATADNSFGLCVHYKGHQAFPNFYSSPPNNNTH